jgi:hypothetical protein
MIDSYWDLYVAYVNKCVRDNWINDIDPHHYRMEWNHWLPKAAFPDLPLGQWLTRRQHSIASALQTLALGECCLCPWHVKFLPKELWEAVRPVYQEHKRRVGNSQVENKTGIHSPDFVYSPELRSRTGRENGEMNKLLKRGWMDPKNIEKWIETRRENGNKNSYLLSQLWESTIDGFVSNAGCVARHNKSKGWDPNARIRVS